MGCKENRQVFRKQLFLFCFAIALQLYQSRYFLQTHIIRLMSNWLKVYILLDFIYKLIEWFIAVHIKLKKK